MNPTSLLAGLGAAISAEPALGATTTSTSGGLGSGDLFLSMVAGMLEGSGEAAAPAATPPSVAEPATPTDDEPATPADQAPAPAPADAVAPSLPEPSGEPTDPAMAILVTTVATTTSPTDPATDSTDDESSTDQATGDVDDTGTEVSAATLATATVLAGIVPIAVPAAAPQAVAAPGGLQQQATDQASVASVTDAGAPEVAAPASTEEHGSDAAGQEATDQSPVPTTGLAPASTEPTGTPSPTVAPITAATAPTTVLTSTTATDAAAPAADPHHVIDQVFSDVIQVAGRAGSGPQRVTVRLHPEDLGEVRVVLSQRDGQLQVSLTVSDQAHATLAQGSDELRHLLAAAGHSDPRIVVRDQSGTTTTTSVTPTNPTAPSGLTGDSAGWTGNGDNGSAAAWADADASDQHRPRSHDLGSTTATDGIPISTNPSGLTESTSRAYTGLDLTM